MNNALYFRLLPILRRLRFRRVMITLGSIWSCLSVIVGLLFYLNQRGQFDVSNSWIPFILVAVFTSFVGLLLSRQAPQDMQTVIHDLERKFPDLDATLITAVEQRSADGLPLSFLQQDVTRRAINHSFINPWSSVIPGWHLFAAPLASLVALAALAGSVVVMVLFGRPILAAKSPLLFSQVVVEKSNFELTVEPGDTEVEKGKSLLILARFGEAIPPDSTLVYAAADGEPIRVPMNKSLDDPVFGARIASVSEPLKYWVEFAQAKSDGYNITVFEYPALVRTDALLHFPKYTKLDDKTVQDVRRVSAVEGTDVEFSFYLNKEIVTATLVPIPKRTDDANQTADASQSIDSIVPIALEQDSVDSNKLITTIKMLASTRYELKLVDSDGRENRIPPTLILNVLENRAPDLKLTSPRRDVQVSAIEELGLAATAWDDFGINSLGLNFSIAGKVANDLVLLKDGAAKQRHEIDHLLEFEALAAQPDELLSYYFWAEDLGPDGEPRRVESDMYFAEVRHFDEIFRQGQAPTAGQQQSQQQQNQNGQNAEQAQQLADLQKEIINATWNLIRRENKSPVSTKFADDTQLLIDSQSDVIQQVEKLAAEVDDASSQSFVEAATTHMKEAILHLSDANSSSSTESLKPALASEQAAYQAMLKLRAREHEVVRAQQQQQGQQGQQSGNRAQQQMEQLNLKDDENRYENERTAQDQQEQNTEQREDRQVLNRLRELARRQEDLNDRVKELQSALEKAETREERAEIERRLKSLRDEQEQMLRDTDELLDRMQQSENQQRMADEAEQLEQTRENLREASDALEKGEVSQAAADGTRAQRDLEELRDEFQNRTAGQFTQQMREMRNEAQDLEKKEQQIADELAGSNEKRPSKNETPSLRSDENESPDLLEQLQKQQESVEQLRERMKETIEEAESYEPLLAEQLYETYRESELSRPDRSLESARESLQRGWTNDAQTQEQNAREGITQMREGIEQAAESVLGDETQALRAAQDTLRELNDQLQEEMKRAQGGQSPNDPSEPSDESENGQRPDGETPAEQTAGQGRGQGSDDPPQPGDGQQQNGQQQNSEPQAGEPRDGEPQDGQPQNGQGQNGQGQNEQRGGGNPDGANDRRGGLNVRTGGGNLRTLEPISGDDFRQWSDRLRDVEEMIADPELRSEAARIRDEAKQIRREANRHSAEPNWDLVKMKISRPLAELQNRVAEELMRRTSRNARVPLDRDPVPTQYQDAVRRYYERIGSGQ